MEQSIIQNKPTGIFKENVKPNAFKNFIEYIKKNKWLYVFLIPGVIYLFIFKYIPMFGIVIAFENFNPVKGVFSSPWVGLDNFKMLFATKDFYSILRNSIILSVYHIVFGFPVPIILALMLNEARSTIFKRISQTVLYLPHFISWVVISGIIVNFLSPSTGLVNYIIRFFGGEAIPFLQKPEYFRSIMVVTEIWKSAGWGTIIYLAAMTGIDVALYDAAEIDGASRMQRIRYITIPEIMSTIIVLLIMRLGHVLDNGFEQIFLLYNQLTMPVADVFETYTYRMGIQLGWFSYATAVGIFKSVIGFILIISANKLTKMLGEKSMW